MLTSKSLLKIRRRKETSTIPVLNFIHLESGIVWKLVYEFCKIDIAKIEHRACP
jgi:hypothetical protein